MKYDFITIGGATEDITFYTNEGLIIDNKEDVQRQKLIAFEYGAKPKIDKSYLTFGGGAANSAVCLSLLGFKVAALIAVGDDERGHKIIKNFKNNKVDTSLIQRYKNIESGFSLVLIGQGNEHVAFSDRAANNKLNIDKKEIQAINKAEWVYLTSLSGRWKDILENVFKGSAKIAWNPGHIQLEAGIKNIGKYLKKTDILFVNKDEAVELVCSSSEYKNKDIKFLLNIKNLLKIIKSWGPKIVIITNGKYGADAYDGNIFYHQGILKEQERVDTTGVGDAFNSTFVAGLKMFQGDIQKSLKLGVTNTASVISKQGAQNGLLSKQEILKKI